MHRRQKFISIAEMVLAELAGCIAERLKQVSDRRIFGLKPDCRSRHSDFGQSGAEWVLAADEGCTSGGAALLAVVVSKGDAFFGDAINVGSAITHHAVAEMTDIPGADVIAPKDQNVGFLLGCHESFLSLGGFRFAVRLESTGKHRFRSLA